jgi:hypothetical protein
MNQVIDNINRYEFMMNGLVALGWISVIGTLLVVAVLFQFRNINNRTK